MKHIKIAPSIISADFSNLEREIRDAENAGASIIHFDVMDGHFVPNITMGPLVLKSLRPKTKLLFDAHLMIVEPIRYVDRFASAGSDIITVHVEACTNIHTTIQKIKKTGVKAGVALNPETPLSKLTDVIEKLDYVLIMSVKPGFSGQKFMPEILPKIREAVKMAIEKKLDIEIGVDGGINADTITSALEAGATVIVAASAVFCPDKSVTECMNILNTKIMGFQKCKKCLK